MFKQATREKLLARIAIEGFSGSGKTLTALLWADELAGPTGKVAVIDTEHRSASKYAVNGQPGEKPLPYQFQFDVCELEHYAPTTYVNAIRAAAQEGYDVLVIDSLSHAWEGTGGALDIVDRKAETGKGGSYAAWRDVTPMQRQLIEEMLKCPCHLIVTMRTKVAYEMEEYEDKGKKKIRVNKLGTKPIQREGMEYEFDVVADIDLEHIVTISKTRCPALDGAKAVKPGGDFIRPLIHWLNAGHARAEVVADEPAFEAASDSAAEPAPDPEKKRRAVKVGGKKKTDPYKQDENDPCGDTVAKEIIDLAKQLKMAPVTIKGFAERCGVAKVAEIPYGKAMTLKQRLQDKITTSEDGTPF